MKKFFLPTFLTLAGMAVAVQAQTSDGLLFEQIDMMENYRVDIPEQDRTVSTTGHTIRCRKCHGNGR